MRAMARAFSARSSLALAVSVALASASSRSAFTSGVLNRSTCDLSLGCWAAAGAEAKLRKTNVNRTVRIDRLTIYLKAGLLGEKRKNSNKRRPRARAPGRRLLANCDGPAKSPPQPQVNP